MKFLSAVLALVFSFNFLVAQPTLHIADANADTTSSLCMAVTVEDFTDVNAMSFTIAWDGDVVDFDAVASLDTAALNDIPPTFTHTGDELSVSWEAGPCPVFGGPAPFAESATIADDHVIFYLCFLSVGDFEDTTSVSFNGNLEPISCAQLDPIDPQDCNEVGFSTLDSGRVELVRPCTADTLTINQDPIISNIYHADTSVISSGKVRADSMVIFRAGQDIYLVPGFLVETFAEFYAEIKPCPELAPMLCSRVACADCESRGWQVVGVFPGEGTLVCTIDGRPYQNNCDSCGLYNIYVWKNGAREQTCLEDDPNGTSPYSTIAGWLYGGHVPCVCADNLFSCGNWDMQGCIPD